MDSIKTTTTRVFKSGNSQAVRIPAEMAFEKSDMEVTITRDGDVITIAPKRQGMKEMFEALRALPKVEWPHEAERIQTRDSDWD